MFLPIIELLSFFLTMCFVVSLKFTEIKLLIHFSHGCMGAFDRLTSTRYYAYTYNCVHEKLQSWALTYFPLFSPERKPLKGLTKKYKTPPQRRRKKKDVEEEEDDNEDEEEDEADGEKIIGNRRLQSNDTHLLFNQWTKVSVLRISLKTTTR